MKRALSWGVLFLVSCVASIGVSLAVWIGAIISNSINGFGEFSILIRTYGAVPTSFSLGLVVAIVGSILTVHASEAVCPTKSGYRYIIYSILLLIYYIMYFVMYLDISAILMCVYAIGILISARNV